MSSNFDNLSLMYCGICKCVLKDPVLTPCLHSFCKSCLETPPSDPTLSSPCDSCSQFLAGRAAGDSNSLNIDSFIESLTYMIDPSSVSIKCKACERVGQEVKSVTHFCTDCDEHMCEGCIMVHNKFLSMICHNTLTLAEYQNIGGKYRDIEIGGGSCQRHSKKILNLFCKACEEFLCKNCVEEHLLSANPQCKHDLHNVKMVAKESRGSVSVSLDKARGNLTTTMNLLTDLSAKVASFNFEQRRAVEEMDAQRAKLIELINKAYEESKRSLLEQTEKRMSYFNKQINQLEIHIDDLSRLISKSSNTLDLIPDVAMIKGCSYLKEKLEVIPPDVKVQSAKFEFCKSLEDESLAAHVWSAFDCFVEHRAYYLPFFFDCAVYVEGTDSFIVCNELGGGPCEVTTSGSTLIHGDYSHCLSLSEDQRHLYSGSNFSKVNVLELGEDGKFQFAHTITVPGNRDRYIRSVNLSPGGRLAVVIDQGLMVRTQDGTWANITVPGLGFNPYHVQWMDDDTICVKGSDQIASISLNQPNHGRHTVLWHKRCHGNILYCAGGMIFVRDRQTFKVLNRHGDEVGLLTCPEGNPVSVCTMKSGMLMALSQLLRKT